jgi:hypothetical protein
MAAAEVLRFRVAHALHLASLTLRSVTLAPAKPRYCDTFCHEIDISDDLDSSDLRCRSVSIAMRKILRQASKVHERRAESI